MLPARGTRSVSSYHNSSCILRSPPPIPSTNAQAASLLCAVPPSRQGKCQIGQMVYDGSEFLQIPRHEPFSSGQGMLPQGDCPRTDSRCRINPFKFCSSDDVAKNVRGGLIQGGYQICGFVAGCPTISAMVSNYSSKTAYEMDPSNLLICVAPAPVPVLWQYGR
jgi:hypothetical protein